MSASVRLRRHIDISRNKAKLPRASPTLMPRDPDLHATPQLIVRVPDLHATRTSYPEHKSLRAEGRGTPVSAARSPLDALANLRPICSTCLPACLQTGCPYALMPCAAWPYNICHQCCPVLVW